MYATQARGICSVLWPYSSRNLNVTSRTYNYILTRARRILLCAFGIVCNKWRIFRRATDVCPDFCDVTVKTYCVLHNFVRQRDCFKFQGNVTGTDMGRRAPMTGMSLCWGQPGRGLVYRWLMCRRRVWRRTPLSIGTPLERIRGWGFRSPINLRDSWRWELKTENSSPWALCEGNLERRSFPEGYVEKALETGNSLHRGPAGEPGRGLV